MDTDKSPFRQKAIVAALEGRRRAKQLPEAVRQQMEALTDWRGSCRVCGAQLEGTLAELKGHVCG